MRKGNGSFWSHARGLSLLLLTACASHTAAGSDAGAAADGTGRAGPANDSAFASEALKLSQENALDIQSLTAKTRELESRLSDLSGEINSLPANKMEALSAQLAALAARLRALEDKLGKPPSPPSGANDSIRSGLPGLRKPPVSDSEAQLYKTAFDFYYAKRYAQATRQFQLLVGRFPTGSFADNAYYWMGECGFATGDYAAAAAAFRKVSDFADSEKADDAQLKLGYCSLKLGDRPQAALEFKKVVSLYPDSEYAAKANDELAKLAKLE